MGRTLCPFGGESKKKNIMSYTKKRLERDLNSWEEYDRWVELSMHVHMQEFEDIYNQNKQNDED